MCLSYRSNSSTPYNASKFRWKFVARHEDGRLEAPFQGIIYNKRNTVGRLEFLSYEQIGFHVFASRAEARLYKFKRDCYSNKSSGSAIKKVKVSGFKASGHFVSTYGLFRSEIWQTMEFVD